MWDNEDVFELSAGQIVADKYRIDGIMGTGGMGVVVAATHVELDQRVAIKFLREVSPEALARFQREARMLVRLKSPHVARVIDVGAMDDDTPYIVMEHLDGSDLATVVTARGRLPVEETVDYILQASEAVAEAHAMGMVHRDLKPANLFLARGPGGTTSVKVLDFGVSKILDDRSNGANDAPRGGDLTNEGVALGSPGYMSPEQMTSSRDVDARSDIFSLGALLYRLVGGQTPYKGTSVVSILATMATDGLLPLRNLAPDAPEDFIATVERCLAQDKAARFPTVAHLAHALMPYASRRGRVSIEQILATLGVHIPDVDASVIRGYASDPSSALAEAMGLADTMVRSGLSDTIVRPALPPAPLLGPAAETLPLAMQTGPQQFRQSAPGWMPPGFRPAPARNPRLTMVIAALGVLGILFGFLMWRVLRPLPPTVGPVVEPSAAVEPTASTASASVSAAITPPVGTEATSAISASAAPETTRPRGTPPTTTRIRPHPSATTHAASGGLSPPPMPTDVPGGRH